MEVTAGKQKRRTGDTGIRGKLALQLLGVQCTKDGRMVIKIELNKFRYDVVEETDPKSDLTVPVVYEKAKDVSAQEGDDGAHENDKGMWVISLQRRRLEPDYETAVDLHTRYKRLMDKKIYLRLKVIWPEGHYSSVVPMSVVIKGIEFPDGQDKPRVNFITDNESGYVSRFMLACMALGFEAGALQPDGPSYDPNYFQPFAEDVELPFTEEQIVEKVLIPVLVRHGQEGHLVTGETSEKSHFIIGKSLQAMSEKEAKRIWLEVQAKEEGAVEAEKEEEKNQPPFFDDETEKPKVDDGGAEKMRAKIRTMGASDPEWAFKVSEFLDSEEIVYDDESLLSSLDVSALSKVIKHFSPEKKPSL